MVHSRLHALSTTAKLIARGGTASSPNGVVLSEASGNVYLGGSDVDTTSGTLLQPGGVLTVDLSVSDDLYAIASAGSPTVKVLTTMGGVVAP